MHLTDTCPAELASEHLLCGQHVIPFHAAIIGLVMMYSLVGGW
jgi:hypothetical protein